MERRWWASSHVERAEWAVRETISDMGMTYRKGMSMDAGTRDRVVTGARAWIRRVGADPVFVREDVDRRFIEIAYNLITLDLLSAMGIKVRTATPTPVSPTPVSPTPVAPTTVAPTTVAPTPIAPTPIAPTPIAPTPIAPTPVAPTPTPTATLTVNRAAVMGLASVWDQDRPAYIRVVVSARAYYIVEDNLFIDLIERGAAAAMEIYRTAGGEPGELSDREWEAHVRSAASASGIFYRDGAPREVKNALFDMERATPTPTPTIPGTPVETDADRLKRWARTAAIFQTFEQCKQAAEAEVGATPTRADCLIESEMVKAAVTHSLRAAGIRPYPGSLELSMGMFDQLTDSAKGIVDHMVYQRTYTPVVGGRVLSLER
jgi:hypothetical protein